MSPANPSNTFESGRLDGSRTFLSRRLEAVGGTAILICRLVQLLVTLSLLGISLSTLRWRDNLHESVELDIQIAQCAFYVRTGNVCLDDVLSANSLQIYVSVLGLLAILSNTPLERRAFVHASLLLAVTWCVYMYRNVWPLATFTESSADLAEGNVLWAKVALLFLGGVALPLLTPRQYIPLNAKVRVFLFLLRRSR